MTDHYRDYHDRIRPLLKALGYDTVILLALDGMEPRFAITAAKHLLDGGPQRVREINTAARQVGNLSIFGQTVHTYQPRHARTDSSA